MRLLLIFILFCSSTICAKETIQLIDTHNQPPFIINAGLKKGMTFDVIEALNAMQDKFHFVSKVYPKARAILVFQDWVSGQCQQTGNCADNWILHWTTPMWGWGENTEDALSKFIWQPYFYDNDAIITRLEDNIEFTTPESLIGYRLGGLIGHYYHGFDELVAAGKLVREDAALESTLLLRVLAKRVDAIILQRSTLDYFLEHDLPVDERAKLQVSRTNYQHFLAQIMIPPQRTDLANLFLMFLQSEQWQAISMKYKMKLPSYTY